MAVRVLEAWACVSLLRHGEGRPAPHPRPGPPRRAGDRHPGNPGRLLLIGRSRRRPTASPSSSTASSRTSGCAARCSTRSPGGEKRRAGCSRRLGIKNIKDRPPWRSWRMQCPKTPPRRSTTFSIRKGEEPSCSDYRNGPGQSSKELPGLETRPTTDKVKESVFNIVSLTSRGGACWICSAAPDSWASRPCPGARRPAPLWTRRRRPPRSSGRT